MNLAISGTNTVAWTVKRTPDGWVGTIDLPIGLALQAHGDTKTQALHGAAAAATKLLENPAVQALLPPGAHQALAVLKSKVARHLASSAWSGVKSLF